jgi:hypothetical protein
MHNPTAAEVVVLVCTCKNFQHKHGENGCKETIAIEHTYCKDCAGIIHFDALSTKMK